MATQLFKLMRTKTHTVYTIAVLLITAILLYIIENGIKRHLESKQTIQPKFKFLPRHDDVYDYTNCCSYNEIDPLLGWAIHPDTLRRRGFKVVNNCTVISNIDPCAEDTLKVFLTGGSTTDQALDTDNWPKFLAERLKKEHVSFVLYNGAVGGYGTSQELLKLLRDGLILKPDLHISYSGANETQCPYFVSYFEENIFVQTIFSANSNKWMPYTTYYLRELLHLNSDAMVLKQPPQISAHIQYSQNMESMNALANGYKYEFLAVLQPVVGFGNIKYINQRADVTKFVNEYKGFYPFAIKHIDTVRYGANFTGIFDTIGQTAFGDDCHLNSLYQPLLADNMFLLISSKIDLNLYKFNSNH